MLRFLLTLILVCHVIACDWEAQASAPLRTTSIGQYAPVFAPAQSITANSEQRIPLLLEYSWNSELKKQGENAIRIIFSALRPKSKKIEIETWPAGADSINRIWVMARWKNLDELNWHWFETEITEDDSKRILVPQIENDHGLIFDDFLAPGRGLYDKPLLGDCFFTDQEGDKVLWAWPAPELQDQVEKWQRSNQAVCRHMPRPPIYKEKATVFNAVTDGVNVQWKSLPPFSSGPGFKHPAHPLRRFPLTNTIKERYITDVKIIAGEIATQEFGVDWPKFERKNSAQSDNQILSLVQYLEARYHAMGIKTKRQEFIWRGIRQYNLIAMIEGSDAKAAPIVVADHMDTAFQEDTFEATKARVAAPGADDNATAAAGLLALSKVAHQQKIKLRRPIWLLHLTGEEFPADDLGARHFISAMLKARQQLHAVLVMDMIGFPGKNNDRGYFQISMGESHASLNLGKVAYSVANNFSVGRIHPLTALLRPRFSPKTYLHQTDALIFSDFGYPVILFNEWLNGEDNWDRPYYHQHNDISDTLDFEYATAILSIVINTTLHLAQ